MSQSASNVVPILSSTPPPDDSFVDAAETAEDSSNDAKQFYADDSLLNTSKATNEDNSVLILENESEPDSNRSQTKETDANRDTNEPHFQADSNATESAIDRNEVKPEEQPELNSDKNASGDIPVDSNAQFDANFSEPNETVSEFILKNANEENSESENKDDALLEAQYIEQKLEKPEADPFADFDTAEAPKINEKSTENKPDSNQDTNFGFATENNDEWNAFGDGTNTDGAASGGDWANFAEQPSQPSFDAFAQSNKETVSVNEEKKSEKEDDEWDDFVAVEAPVVAQPQKLAPPPSMPKIQIGSPQVPKTQMAPQQSPQVKKELLSLEEFNAKYSKRADELMEEVLAQMDAYKVDADSVECDSSVPYFDEDTQKIYDHLFDFENSECLKFTWKGSKLEEMLIESLDMVRPTNLDKEHFFFDDFETSDVLEPVKVDTLAVKTKNESIQKSHSAAEFGKMKSEASSASLNLNIDLSYFEAAKSQSSSKAVPKSSTILLNQLLDEIYPSEAINKDESQAAAPSISVTFSETSEIDDKLNELVDQLPNLSFMKSKSLMFPVSSTDSEITNSE